MGLKEVKEACISLEFYDIQSQEEPIVKKKSVITGLTVAYYVTYCVVIIVVTIANYRTGGTFEGIMSPNATGPESEGSNCTRVGAVDGYVWGETAFLPTGSFKTHSGDNYETEVKLLLNADYSSTSFGDYAECMTFYRNYSNWHISTNWTKSHRRTMLDRDMIDDAYLSTLDNGDDGLTLDDGDDFFTLHWDDLLQTMHIANERYGDFASNQCYNYKGTLRCGDCFYYEGYWECIGADIAIPYDDWVLQHSDESTEHVQVKSEVDSNGVQFYAVLLFNRTLGLDPERIFEDEAVIDSVSQKICDPFYGDANGPFYCIKHIPAGIIDSISFAQNTADLILFFGLTFISILLVVHHAAVQQNRLGMDLIYPLAHMIVPVQWFNIQDKLPLKVTKKAAYSISVMSIIAGYITFIGLFIYYKGQTVEERTFSQEYLSPDEYSCQNIFPIPFHVWRDDLLSPANYTMQDGTSISMYIDLNYYHGGEVRSISNYSHCTTFATEICLKWGSLSPPWQSDYTKTNPSGSVKVNSVGWANTTTDYDHDFAIADEWFTTNAMCGTALNNSSSASDLTVIAPFPRHMCKLYETDSTYPPFLCTRQVRQYNFFDLISISYGTSLFVMSAVVLSGMKIWQSMRMKRSNHHITGKEDKSMNFGSEEYRLSDIAPRTLFKTKEHHEPLLSYKMVFVMAILLMFFSTGVFVTSWILNSQKEVSDYLFVSKGISDQDSCESLRPPRPGWRYYGNFMEEYMSILGQTNTWVNVGDVHYISHQECLDAVKEDLIMQKVSNSTNTSNIPDFVKLEFTPTNVNLTFRIDLLDVALNFTLESPMLDVLSHNEIRNIMCKPFEFNPPYKCKNNSQTSALKLMGLAHGHFELAYGAFLLIVTLYCNLRRNKIMVKKNGPLAITDEIKFPIYSMLHNSVHKDDFVNCNTTSRSFEFSDASSCASS